MSGLLNDVLPDPISADDERILLDLLRRKMMGSARLAVELLHAMEERFGPEARAVMRDLAQRRAYTSRPNPGRPDDDLQEFCAGLERACVGSHRWERLGASPDRIAYRFTHCLWADIYRELGEPDLGFVFCAGDEPAVKAHNPNLAFARTTTLMEGADACDHVFFVQSPDGARPPRIDTDTHG